MTFGFRDGWIPSTLMEELPLNQVSWWKWGAVPGPRVWGKGWGPGQACVDLLCLRMHTTPSGGHTGVWVNAVTQARAPSTDMHRLNTYGVPATFQAPHCAPIDCDGCLHFTDEELEAPGVQATCWVPPAGQGWGWDPTAGGWVCSRHQGRRGELPLTSRAGVLMAVREVSKEGGGRYAVGP